MDVIAITLCIFKDLSLKMLLYLLLCTIIWNMIEKTWFLWEFSTRNECLDIKRSDCPTFHPINDEHVCNILLRNKIKQFKIKGF